MKKSTTMLHKNSTLPKGVYYEKNRKRYRIRLHYKQKIVWLTYHKRKHEALQTINIAKAHQEKIAREENSVKNPKELKELICRHLLSQ